MDNQIIEQIVDKAANAVMHRIEEQKREIQQAEPERSIADPMIYGVAIKRRLLWPKRYKVIAHFEDRAIQGPNDAIYPCPGRLVLTFPDQSRLAIPNLEYLQYSVYPL